MIMIMQFLTLYDRISASMTCRYWNKIFRETPRLREKEEILIKGNNEAKELFKRKPNSLFKPVMNLVICDIKLTFEKHFWKAFGSEIRSLVFYNCKLPKTATYEILLNCPNLERLEFLECGFRQTAMEKISTLTHQHLRHLYVQDITDCTMKNFLINCKRLESLDLSLNFFVSGNTLYHANVIEEIQNSQDWAKLNNLLYESVLTTLSITLFLPFNNIKRLNFTHTSISTEILEICKLKEKGLRLEELILDGCTKFKGGIEAIADAFADTLKILHIGGCPIILDELMNVSKLINLEELDMSVISSVDDEVIKTLSCLDKLQKFTLCKARDVQPDTIKTVLSPMKNLTCLSLKRIEFSSMESLLDLLNSLTGLTELYLSYIEGAYAEKFVEALCNNHKAITKLALNVLKNNEKVNLRYRCRKDESGTLCKLYGQYCKEETHGIHDLKRLRHFEIIGSYLDQESIEELKLNELTALYLDMTNVEDEDAAISFICDNCPALIELHLSGCTWVNDFGMSYIKNLRRLKRLFLKKCPNITASGVSYLQDSDRPLVHVVVEKAKKATITSTKRCVIC